MTKEAWESIQTRAYACSRNVNIQELCLKVKSRMYKTSTTLHKCFPNGSPLCWRCHSATGDMLHMQWLCPLLQSYWKQEHEIVCKIVRVPLDFVPSLFLLQLPSGGLKQSHKALGTQLINAARMCIPVYCQTYTIPVLSEWLKNTDRVCEMEELVYTSQDQFGKFYEIWAAWLHYRDQTRI